jgi:hypothetical protein
MSILPPMPWDSPDARHDCPERERHRGTEHWKDDSDGHGAAILRVEVGGSWWAHNHEYATEIAYCPWCGRRLDDENR